MSIHGDACLTLDEAVAVCRELFPSGRITRSSLRSERERGRLQTFKVAGKVFTTRAMLLQMIESCKARPVTSLQSTVEASATYSPAPGGAVSPARARTAQAAALLTLERLKRPRSAPIEGLKRRPIPSTRASS